jgi:hypothetical protein
MATATLDTINNTLIGDRKIQSENTILLRTMARAIMEQLKMDKAAKYDNLESSAESKKSKDGAGGGGTSLKPDLKRLKTPFGLLTAGISLAFGMVREYVRIISKFISSFAKLIGGSKISKGFVNSKAITALVNFFKSLKTLFLSRLFISTFTMIGELATDIGQKFKFVGSKLMIVVNAIKNYLFAPMQQFSSTIRDALKSLAKPFKAVTKFFKSSKSSLKVFTLFGTFFRVVGVVAARFLTPLIAAYGFITGFFKGFKRGGFFEGLKQGFTDMLNLVYAAPMDLVKDLIGWIAGKIGFENFEELLASFTFKELFTKMVDGLYGLAGKGIDFIKNAFLNPGETFDKMFGEDTLYGKFITPLIKAPYNLIMWVKDKILGFFTSVDDADTPKFSFKDFFFGPEGIVTKIWDWLKGLFTFDKAKMDKIGMGMFKMATMFKALAAAGIAAVKAAVPGGKTPGEAFNEVYNSMMGSGGSAGTTPNVTLDGEAIATNKENANGGNGGTTSTVVQTNDNSISSSQAILLGDAGATDNGDKKSWWNPFD